MRPPAPQAVAAFWRAAATGLGIDPGTTVAAFQFGDTAELADALAAAVRDGPKRATASLMAELTFDGDQTPTVGSYWVACGGDGLPVVVLQTREVTVAPFRTADAAFAWDEGEGDRSLGWWRAAHIEFFRRSCARIGIDWSEALAVVLERFEVLWPPDAAARAILRRPSGAAEWDAYHQLRRVELFERYLRGVTYDPDFPENWSAAVFHFGWFAAGALLACLQVRLRPADVASFHLVAVIPRERRRGIGRQLLAAGERFAQVNGRRVVRLFAEPGSEGFYRKLGYGDGGEWDQTPPSDLAVSLKKRL